MYDRRPSRKRLRALGAALTFGYALVLAQGVSHQALVQHRSCVHGETVDVVVGRRGDEPCAKRQTSDAAFAQWTGAPDARTGDAEGDEHCAFAHHARARSLASPWLAAAPEHAPAQHWVVSSPLLLSARAVLTRAPKTSPPV